jgi:hypothetical protein
LLEDAGKQFHGKYDISRTVDTLPEAEPIEEVEDEKENSV